MELIHPDFEKSILNVSATFSNFLGKKISIATIPFLDKKLRLGYKNVVYFCLDGMGVFPLTQNLDESSFLRKNVCEVITSVFPSTTTNATTSLLGATYPLSHGMFGWSMYIPALEKVVDVFTQRDSLSGEEIPLESYQNTFDISFYFDDCKSEYQTSGVFPPYVNHQKNNFVYNTLDEMFILLNSLCKKEGKQFVYCYHGEPDSTMHRYGVTSRHSRKIFSLLNDKIQEFAENNPDTLIVITSDHGQTDITDYIELFKDEELLATLDKPMYMEARAVAFRIKPDFENAFLKAMEKYQDIKVFKTEDMIKENFFGKGDKGYLLGDYIGVVTNDHSQLLLSPTMVKFKGHHTSLSEKEMHVPLIVIN